MRFTQIVDAIETRFESLTGKNIDKKIIYNNLFFAVSSLIGLKRLKVKGNFVNFIGITFAMSGSGKDLSLKIIEDKIEPLRVYPDILLAQKFIKDKDKELVPNSYKTSLLGTINGLMMYGNYLNNIDIGSININEQEFGSVMNRAIMDFITKLWQTGNFISSINVNQRYDNINNVPINALLFGSMSSFERDLNKYKELIEVLETGFARRGFFIYSKNHKLEFRNPDIAPSLEFNDVIEFIQSFERFDEISISKEANELINEYQNRLIKKYNSEPTEWNAIKVNSIDKIIRLSAIVAVINLNKEVSMDDMQVAIEFNRLSNKDFEEVIKPKEPYLKMWEVVNIYKTIFKTELMNKLGLKLNKNEMKDQIEMLKEYAYINNKRLIDNGMTLHLKDFEDSSLNEIIVSINTENKGLKGVEPSNRKLPMFGSGKTIEELIKSNVDWFSFSHFNGKRSIKNVISEFNAIALDIDDLLPLDMAQDLLYQYTYLGYTTKSHNIEKNGFVADRYRIILPLNKTVVGLNNEQYKEFVKNLVNIVGFDNYIDTSTIEVARLWFPNQDAIVLKNIQNMIDIRYCMPDTEIAQQAQKVIKTIKEVKKEGSLTSRLEGAVRWTLVNAIVGQRNNILFRGTMLIKDLSGVNEARDWLYKMNNMLLEPLSEKEVKTTIEKRLNRY
jgi:hypothetical protein